MGSRCRDHAGGDARVARRRIELVVTEESLNDSDIGLTFEQMGRKTVAQRMQRHRLLDPGRVSRLMEQAVECRVVIGLPALMLGNSQRSCRGIPAS